MHTSVRDDRLKVKREACATVASAALSTSVASSRRAPAALARIVVVAISGLYAQQPMKR